MITGKAAAALPSTRRKKLGDGMMEPTRAMELENPVTGWFRLIPGVHRVSIDHWAYKRHPEHFKVANSDDTQTVARHRQTLERAQRQIDRQLGRTGTTRPSAPAFRLPTSNPRETWRLP